MPTYLETKCQEISKATEEGKDIEVDTILVNECDGNWLANARREIKNIE